MKMKVIRKQHFHISQKRARERQREAWLLHSLKSASHNITVVTCFAKRQISPTTNKTSDLAIIWVVPSNIVWNVLFHSSHGVINHKKHKTSTLSYWKLISFNKQDLPVIFLFIQLVTGRLHDHTTVEPRYNEVGYNKILL